MADFKYPVQFRAKHSGLIVEFYSVSSGKVIKLGVGTLKPDAIIQGGWIPHTDDHWEPVESTKIKLHNAVKDYRGYL